jgi:hypothetical protein
MHMLHLYVDVLCRPSGRFIANGFFATRLFSTSTPSMMKMKVASVLAIACIVTMVMVLRHSQDAIPNLQTPHPCKQIKSNHIYVVAIC